MITIYHLGVSQSDRIVWLMEELGLPYQLEWYDRGPDRLAPPEYLALHPAAMAPVIRDGDLVLAESTAIVQYIAHKHGSGRLTVAPNSPHYADYLYWLQFNNNVLTMTAGLAGLTKVYTRDDVAAHNARGEKLKAELNALFQAYQAGWQVIGVGTLLNFHPVGGPVERAEDAQKGDMRWRRLLFLHLLEQGIYIAERGYMALSLAITDADCEKLKAGVEEFLIRYRALA